MSYTPTIPEGYKQCPLSEATHLLTVTGKLFWRSENQHEENGRHFFEGPKASNEWWFDKDDELLDCGFVAVKELPKEFVVSVEEWDHNHRWVSFPVNTSEMPKWLNRSSFSCLEMVIRPKVKE